MEWSTKDFNTIALLKYFGYKFTKVSREGINNKTKRVFVEDSEELQQMLLDYDNGDLDVNAQRLFRAVDEAKEFVHR